MEQKYDYRKENFLIVDDELDVGKVVKGLLSNLGFNAYSVTSGKNALEEIRNKNYTFLLTDINMPELNGIELIKIVKKEYPDINIIAMTGFDKDYAYIDVIHAGANDFITKPFNVDEIEAKIRRILIERHIKNELALASITDSLTGLFNHRHFYDRLKKEIDRANRQKHPLSIILIDLDRFKDYNDKHGHLAGDKMLVESAKIILSNIRENVDTAFRYGGDEFAVILVEADDNIARKISGRIEWGFEQCGDLTASVGFSTYLNEMNIEDLIEVADKNLYKGKRNNWKI